VSGAGDVRFAAASARAGCDHRALQIGADGTGC